MTPIHRLASSVVIPTFTTPGTTPLLISIGPTLSWRWGESVVANYTVSKYLHISGGYSKGESTMSGQIPGVLMWWSLRYGPG